MTDRLAATALRLLAPRANAEGPGDHDSLENIITDELPNGALCWVVATEGLYRLDKLDNTTAAVLGVVIIPLAGPGRWILLASGSPLAQLSAELFLIGDNGLSLTQPSIVITPAGPEVWTAGPSVVPLAPAIYDAVLSPVWEPTFFSTVGSKQGSLLYIGPTRRYLLEVYATVGVATTTTIILGITSDAPSSPRLGTTTNDGTEGIETSDGDIAYNFVTELSAARSVVLSAGNVIRPVLSNTDNALEPSSVDMLVRRLHLVATPFE